MHEKYNKKKQIQTEIKKTLTGPEMNTESFLSLRTFKKFFVFLSLVKVFFLFLFLGFVFLFHCTLSTARCCIYLRVVENPYITVMALVGFSTSAV